MDRKSELRQKLHRGFFRLSRRIVSVLIVAGLVTAGTIGVRATEDIRKRLEEAKQRRDQTQSELSNAQQNINSLEEGRQALQNNMNTLNDQLYAVGQNLLTLNEQIVAKQEQIDEMTAVLAEATAIKDAQYEAMKKRVQFIYERQEFVLTDMMMQSTSLTDFLNQGAFIEAMSSYDRQKLVEYQSTEEQIAFQKAQLEADMAELRSMQEQQAQEQNRFYGLINEVAADISEYNSEISVAELEAEAIRELLRQQQAEVVDWEQKLQEQLKISQEAREGSWTSVEGLTFYEVNEMGISDLDLLAHVIYTEAGNQPYEGQVAVGAVIINRMRSSRFAPNTVFQVISAPRQFAVYPTFLQRSIDNGWATDSCYRAARDAMSGYSPVGDCLFFCQPRFGPESGGIVIGGHVFY